MPAKFTISNVLVTMKAIAKEISSGKSAILVNDGKLLLEELRQNTPIDTGFARESWSMEEKSSNSENVDQVTLRNTASYIEALNAGHSKQAPPFFIEKTALKYGKPDGVIVEIEKS